MICEKIRSAGGRAYLVGGCVRDLLIGKGAVEWDLEVFSIGSVALEELFDGAIDFVGKSYGIYRFRKYPIDMGVPRMERATGPGHREFSVTVDPAMAIDEAAVRRDFTVNAIYWDPLENVIHDPFGGIGDLEKRKLRHVSDRFSEDPLRVLRAMQFVARFSMAVDEKTIAICRSLSADHLSRERIGGEFSKLIVGGEAIGDGLEFLRLCGWLRFFPELEALVHCRQDPTFHPEGSVWEHVKLAMDAFCQLRPNCTVDALAVGFAVLCHDFGKPATAERRQGHGPAGVAPARKFLERLAVAKDIVAMVLPLVAKHMVPRTFGDPAAATVGTLRRLAWEVGRIDLLLAVARCDNLGRALARHNFAGEDRLERMAAAECLLHSPPKPLVRGRDLCEELQMQPSPLVGATLARVFNAQLDGEFSSRTEAMAAARRMVMELSGSGSGTLPIK
jgi:tRNA nucleotidyltransferase (CCA-adding enzyme)